MANPRFAVIAVVLLAPISSTAQSPYDRYFDSSWRWSELKPYETDRPCLVKAAGWKILDTERRKKRRGSWYSIPDKHMKWGYKVVLEVNPIYGEAVFDSLEVEIRSRDGFELDTDKNPPIELQRSGRLITGTTQPSLGLILNDSPGVVQGTAWYNATEKAGEGGPSYLHVASVRCRATE